METANLFSPLILVNLISNMLLMALSVFQMNLVSFAIRNKIQQYKNSPIHYTKTNLFQRFTQIDFEMAIILSGVLISLSNLFLFCYFGKVTTDSFEKMAACLYSEVDWSELPVELQKYLILMIANVQRPLYYHGFYVTILNLETFCSVGDLIN